MRQKAVSQSGQKYLFQKRNNINFLAVFSQLQRSPVVRIFQIHSGSILQKNFYNFNTSIFSCTMKGRHKNVISSINIRSILKKELDNFPMTIFSGNMEGSLATCTFDIGFGTHFKEHFNLVL